jgi:hypothetical protein
MDNRSEVQQGRPVCGDVAEDEKFLETGGGTVRFIRKISIQFRPRFSDNRNTLTPATAGHGSRGMMVIFSYFFEINDDGPVIQQAVFTILVDISANGWGWYLD